MVGGVLRPHLVELDHYNILEPLKGTPNLNHSLHISNWGYMKGNFKNYEAYQNFEGERAVRLPGKWG